MKLTKNEAWRGAVEAHEAGQYEEADKLYSAILALNPKDPSVNYNLGIVGVQMGHLRLALKFFRTAIEVSPSDESYWISYASTMIDLNDFQDARITLKKAKRNGISKQSLNKLKQKLKAYSTNDPNLLGLNPSQAQLQALKKLFTKGRYPQAIGELNELLERFPNCATLCNMQGVAYSELGYIDEAVASFMQAITLKPDYDEAYVNIGVTLNGVTFVEPVNGLADVLSELLQRNLVRPLYIAPAALSLLKLEPTIKPLLEHRTSSSSKQFSQQAILALAEHPLLLNLLSRSPLAELHFESLFINIRSTVLEDMGNIPDSPDTLAFYSALALHCFVNEYIYPQTSEETQILLELEAKVCEALESGEQPSPLKIVCLASYKSLSEYSWCHLLDMPESLKDLAQRQIWDIAEEESLKLEIQSLGEQTNDISLGVRDQYEQNPYPRWINCGNLVKPQSVSQVLYGMDLNVADHSCCESQSPDILIAGCGTGLHAIDSSFVFKDSRLLAIDLSLASLSFAKRKTIELDISNIEYMQSDILDLKFLHKQFDIIESVGVLHHMEDPMAGWQILVDRLKTGGLMRIGLYSELARAHISKIRQEIREAGLELNDSEMKKIRAKILGSDQRHHKKITLISDFYSLSELRDLLFHVQEHQFSIPQIASNLEELGLAFCGFSDPKIKRQFSAWHSDEDAQLDLTKWNAFEKANPDIFMGMYQFWCQKIG